MSDSPHVFDVTEVDFNQRVIENSYKQPVFVDFWAEWCGPCQALMPLMEKLAIEYQGKFALAKVNSDEQSQLASQYGVRSLPTIKVFKNGQEVDSFTGVQAEPVIKTIIEAHIDRESDKLRKAGIAAIKNSEPKKALELLSQAVAMDPDRDNLKLDLAKGYVATGDAEKATQIINALPFNLRNSDEAEKILAMVGFIEESKNAPAETVLETSIKKNPNDLQARYQLGSLKILADDNEAGLKQFLEIMQCDRKYGNDAGHHAILAVFKLLGDEHELVKQYRRKMAMLLH